MKFIHTSGDSGGHPDTAMLMEAVQLDLGDLDMSRFVPQPPTDSSDNVVTFKIADEDLARCLQKAFIHAITLCTTDQSKDVF